MNMRLLLQVRRLAKGATALYVDLSAIGGIVIVRGTILRRDGRCRRSAIDRLLRRDLRVEVEGDGLIVLFHMFVQVVVFFNKATQEHFVYVTGRMLRINYVSISYISWKRVY